MTSSIIETMMNIRTTSMSMNTMMKKRRRKTVLRREKGEIDEMSKMNTFMKTKEMADFEYNRHDDEY